MNQRTTWGYSVAQDEPLDAFLTLDEFNRLTANKYAGDIRIEENIKAACAAVRNYCGWHVFPNLTCIFSAYMLNENGRIKQSNRDLIIQLPAAFVSEIISLGIGDAEWDDYALESNGLLYVFGAAQGCLNRKTNIGITYKAGLDAEQMDAIKELIAHRVTHALASSAGVQSESAGGVSITYAANWINSARSTALASDNKEVLEPYKVRGVF